MIRAAALLACLLLAACGQRGPLYLPDEAKPVAVPVTPAANPATAPASNADTSTTDEERRRRQQQPAAPGNSTGN